MKKYLLFIFVFIYGINTTSAQCINFVDYTSDSSNWKYPTGISHYYNDTFVLTTTKEDQAGYFYYDSPVSLVGAGANFNTNFDFRIDSGRDAHDTSDGIAFWFFAPGFSNFSNHRGGEECGLPVIGTGLAIIFDIHDNDMNGNNPLVSLRRYNGYYHEGDTAGLIAPDAGNLPFLADGNWHSCNVQYHDGSISVAFDGNPPIISGYYLLNMDGYFGFCGGTGAGWSDQSVRNISICQTNDSIMSRESSCIIPNAFTPNGDGVNDIIYPTLNGDFILDDFNIYNRMGQLLFHTNYIKGWDGKFNGVRQDMGVYLYTIAGHKSSTKEKITYKGDITLIR